MKLVPGKSQRFRVHQGHCQRAGVIIILNTFLQTLPIARMPKGQTANSASVSSRNNSGIVIHRNKAVVRWLIIPVARYKSRHKKTIRLSLLTAAFNILCFLCLALQIIHNANYANSSYFEHCFILALDRNLGIAPVHHQLIEYSPRSGCLYFYRSSESMI